MGKFQSNQIILWNVIIRHFRKNHVFLHGRLKPRDFMKIYSHLQHKTNTFSYVENIQI